VPEYDGDTSYVDAVLDVAADTEAPLVVLTVLPAALDEEAADRLRAAGVPVLEGFRSGLLAVRHLLDAVARPSPDALDHPLVTEAVPLLAAYGIAAPESRSASSEADVLAAAAEIGWPVVLKTAAHGITHRSDVQGVLLDVGDADAALAAYRDLAHRLGPDVTVHRQVPSGVELSIGLVRDPALGLLVVAAAGGVLVELLDDRAVALPPLSPAGARRMLDRLRLRPLLDGFRGAPAVDLEALVEMVVAVSRIAHEHGDDLDAMDLNPVIATPDGAVAADVLVVPRVAQNEEASSCTA
jgi:acetate---CoA ligase (ADP-forming)